MANTPSERDTDIHHKANKCGSRERCKTAKRCLTIEHKATGQTIVDKRCDAEAETARRNDTQLGADQQRKAARVDDGCDPTSHTISQEFRYKVAHR